MTKELNSRGNTPLSSTGDLMPVSKGSDVYFPQGSLGIDDTRATTRHKYDLMIKKLRREGYHIPMYNDQVVSLIENIATKKFTTVKAYVCAIKWYHRTHGFPTPDQFGRVKSALKALKKLKVDAGEEPSQVAEMCGDIVREVVEYYEDRPSTYMNERDKVIIILMYYTAMRRSEVVSLNISRVRFDNQGMLIVLQKAKNNKRHIRVHRNIYEPYLCIITMLERYIAKYHSDSHPYTPLFFSSHATTEGIKKGNKRMPDNSVARMIKRVMGRIGLPNFESFSGHSPRRGYVTDAVMMNNNIAQISQDARMDINMVKHYAEMAQALTTDDIMRKSAKIYGKKRR